MKETMKASFTLLTFTFLSCCGISVSAQTQDSRAVEKDAFEITASKSEPINQGTFQLQSLSDLGTAVIASDRPLSGTLLVMEPNGRKVQVFLNGTFGNGSSLDFSALEPGTYYLVYKDEYQTLKSTLVKR